MNELIALLKDVLTGLDQVGLPDYQINYQFNMELKSRVEAALDGLEHIDGQDE